LLYLCSCLINPKIILVDSFLFFLEQGFFHVLDGNTYDHMLFLIVLLVTYSFKELVKVIYAISMFTFGHSLTLLLSSYQIVSVNINYIEFLIPMTLVVFAVYTIFTVGKTSKKGNFYFQIIMSLFFGLIHGLGFAKGFNAIVGSANKFISLLEYSLGIEAAQLVAAVVILFIGYIFQTIFRFSKRDWTLVISSVVLGLVIPMLITNKIW
jgi:hypothetical protein